MPESLYKNDVSKWIKGKSQEDIEIIEKKLRLDLLLPIMDDILIEDGKHTIEFTSRIVDKDVIIVYIDVKKEI